VGVTSDNILFRKKGSDKKMGKIAQCGVSTFTLPTRYHKCDQVKEDGMDGSGSTPSAIRCAHSII
jgi:hypothetical protein